MFTDDAVTPIRLEILIDLLRSSRQGLAREDLYRLLQPEPLCGESQKFIPAKATVRAGLELQLIVEEAGKLSLSEPCRKQKDTQAAILAAFDKVALGSAEVEKYLALFYSFYLGLGQQADKLQGLSGEQWADNFNQMIFGNVAQENRFNGTKLTGLHRWFGYVGLGWYDPSGALQANPYDRIFRALPAIFGRLSSLDADPFMAKLGTACPELDGGALFLQANRGWQADEKRCTLGFSHALIELHFDGYIQLVCPADSGGWNIGEAEPPHGGDFFGDRFSTVKFLSRK
jgi:hypothetical protein